MTAPAQLSEMPVLYSFRRCPYAIRARLALRYAGIQCALRDVVLRDKPAAMLQVSSKGTVPVLVIPSGADSQEVIDESLDIMLWAVAQSDRDGWLNVDYKESNSLLTANDEDFKIWLDRYKYPNRYDDFDSAEPRAECARFLSALDHRVRQNGCLTSAHMNFVDYAIAPFIRQCAFVDIDWFRSEFSALHHWLERFLQGALFTSVMVKYPQWQPDDEVILF